MVEEVASRASHCKCMPYGKARYCRLQFHCLTLHVKGGVWMHRFLLENEGEHEHEHEK